MPITNAAAPITGGIICPLTEEETSIARLFQRETSFFHDGNGKGPVVTVLAIDEPEIIPVIPEPKIAAFVGSSHFTNHCKS